MALNQKTRCIYEALDQMGIVHPAFTIELARKNGLSVSLVAAILLQESAGGNNVFGHDPYLRPTRRLNWLKGRKVTRLRYWYYKRMRKAGHGMNGVGPMQLTWYTFQDAADALGGAWQPHANMTVGVGHLADMITKPGVSERDAIVAYNGAGEAAQRYADQVLAKKAQVHNRIQHCV